MAVGDGVICCAKASANTTGETIDPSNRLFPISFGVFSQLEKGVEIFESDALDIEPLTRHGQQLKFGVRDDASGAEPSNRGGKKPRRLMPAGNASLAMQGASSVIEAEEMIEAAYPPRRGAAVQAYTAITATTATAEA